MSHKISKNSCVPSSDGEKSVSNRTSSMASETRAENQRRPWIRDVSRAAAGWSAWGAAACCRRGARRRRTGCACSRHRSPAAAWPVPPRIRCAWSRQPTGRRLRSPPGCWTPSGPSFPRPTAREAAGRHSGADTHPLPSRGVPSRHWAGWRAAGCPLRARRGPVAVRRPWGSRLRRPAGPGSLHSPTLVHHPSPASWTWTGGSGTRSSPEMRPCFNYCFKFLPFLVYSEINNKLRRTGNGNDINKLLYNLSLIQRILQT